MTRTLTPKLATALADHIESVAPADRAEWTSHFWNSKGDP